MQPDFEQSLDAQSEFIPIGKKKQEQDLGQSLVAQSEKIYFQNASTINRQELEQAHKHLAATKAKVLPSVQEQGGEEESANQFLEVGKWKKAKESTLSRDMENVKKQVDQIITQTKWKKKPEPHEEEAIADQSIAPEDTDEIQDQTQQDQAEEEGEQEEEQQEEEEEQDEEQEEEESEEEEEEESEQSQQQQEEQEEQQKTEVENNQEEKEEELPLKSPQNTVASKPSPKPSPRSINELSMLSDDDRTDTKSEMKKTEYLPSKWSKKGSQMTTEDPWHRKQAILLRIAKLVS